MHLVPTPPWSPSIRAAVTAALPKNSGPVFMECLLDGGCLLFLYEQQLCRFVTQHNVMTYASFPGYAHKALCSITDNVNSDKVVKLRSNFFTG